MSNDKKSTQSLSVTEAGSSHATTAGGASQSEGYRNPSDTDAYESSADTDGRGDRAGARASEGGAGAAKTTKQVSSSKHDESLPLLKQDDASALSISTLSDLSSPPTLSNSSAGSSSSEAAAAEKSLSMPKPAKKADTVALLVESVLECSAQYENLQTIVTLGAGAFGRVDLVRDLVTGHSYALKTISKVKVASKTSSIAHLYNEKKALETIESDFIVKMYKTFNLEHKCCFLFEPILGGELFTFMQINKRLSERMSRFYAACAILALEDIHSTGMVYRDLKPENMLIGADGYLKFADFGFAKTLKPWAKSFSLVGTPEYLPPEIIANEGHDRGFDMWTLGVLIYEMLSRRTPFHDRHRRTMFNKICNVRYSFPSFFPSEAADLVRNLLRRRPIYRLGVVGGMESIKKHPWFDGFDWDALRNRTMKAPYIPKIKNTTDTSNFARVNKDKIPKFPNYLKDQAIFDGF